MNQKLKDRFELALAYVLSQMGELPEGYTVDIGEQFWIYPDSKEVVIKYKLKRK